MPYWKRLQPLRIPGGWTVMFHKLEDLEPEELLGSNVAGGGPGAAR